MYFERIPTQHSKKLAIITAFLHQNDLTLDSLIEQFVVVFNEQEQMIACAGLAGNIIKCVAIDESFRGEGIALKLATEVINLAYDLGRSHLFIYTKPEYETLFRSCGFYTISAAYPNVVLMENSATRLQKKCQQWHEKYIQGEKIGAIVMNANPFTLGHHYLIERALQQCEHLHLFVVEENISQFSYQDRFSLVKQGIEGLKHITLHSGSDYIISRATFPNYFLKDKGLTDELYLELDLKLFRQYIAPALGITHRFIGTEPFCQVTAEYNRKMHFWLMQAEMISPAIQVVELARKMVDGQPISASHVRQLLQQKKWNEIQSLVPPTTFHFLQEMKM